MILTDEFVDSVLFCDMVEDLVFWTEGFADLLIQTVEDLKLKVVSDPEDSLSGLSHFIATFSSFSTLLRSLLLPLKSIYMEPKAHLGADHLNSILL